MNPFSPGKEHFFIVGNGCPTPVEARNGAPIVCAYGNIALVLSAMSDAAQFCDQSKNGIAPLELTDAEVLAFYGYEATGVFTPYNQEDVYKLVTSGLYAGTGSRLRIHP